MRTDYPAMPDQAGPVSALMLGLIKRPVRRIHHGLGIDHTEFLARHADADGDTDIRVAHPDVCGSHLFSQAFGHVICRFQIRIVADNQELFAAKATNAVILAGHVLDCFCGLLEYDISYRMPIVVIYRFEMIDIDHDSR